MTAALVKSPIFTVARLAHHGVVATTYFTTAAGVVDNADTRAAFHAGYAAAAEADRRMDGAGNIN
jgi:hypothetical protein